MIFVFTLRTRLCLALIVLCCVAGCNDPSDLGAEFVPSVPVAVDSLQIQIKSLKEPIIHTDIYAPFFQMPANRSSILLDRSFGTARDPHFGTIQAATYLELLPLSTTAANIGGINPVLDSVVLFLHVSGVYGKPSDKQNLIIQLLADTMLSAANTADGFNDGYVSSDTIRAYSAVNYVNNVEFSFRDSAAIDTVLRYRLSNAFGDTLLRRGIAGFSFNGAEVTNGDSARARQRETRDLLRGLYISSVPVGPTATGGIINLLTQRDQSSAVAEARNTRIQLHYTYTDTVAGANDIDTLVTFFYPNASLTGQRFHSIKRFNTSGKVVEKAESGFASFADANIVLQAAQGYTSFLELPDIETNLRPGQGPPGVVNEATLTFTIDTTFYKTAAEKVFILPRSGQLSLFEALPASEQENRYPGLVSVAEYDSAKHTYTFRIREMIQNQWLGVYPTLRFAIRFAELYNGFGRVILCGNGHPIVANRPKLKVYYTSAPNF
jgi:hypothetical protein